MTVATLVIINNRQYIIDQITVWQYKPTSNVASLMERSGVNDYGKFLFYSGQPILDGTQNFNSECDRIENMTNILGCYSDWKIYIYDVQDDDLDGIKEVTATHEMLHAAYIRLGSDEKDKVDKLLETEYQKLEGDEEFKELMEFYGRTEPGQRQNELHSVIGTEAKSVSSELEKYFGKYFSDRQKVVSLNEKYTTVFANLEARAEAISTQLNELSSSIASGTSQYNSDVADINSDITAFNKKANSGGFTSLSQFNNEKSLLLARVADLENDRATINANIAKFNELINEYNSISSQSKKLNNSIDSTLAPAPLVE